MDPKQQPSPSLDPKLKEAYERVMGTGGNTPATSTTPTPIVGTPTITPTIKKADEPIGPISPIQTQATTPSIQPSIPAMPISPTSMPTTATPGVIAPPNPMPAIAVSPQPATPSPFQ